MDALLEAFYKYRQELDSSDTTSLSYYMILSLVPILTLILIALSYIHFDFENVTTTLLKYFSSDMTTMIVEYLTEHDRYYFSLAAILLSLIVSSRGIYRLNQVTNRLYEVPSSYLEQFKHRFKAMLDTVTFVLLVVVIIMLFGALPLINLFFFDLIWGRIILGFVLVFLLMLLINLIVPSVWPGFKAGCCGALVSSIGIVFLHLFMGLFSNATTYHTIYGPLATIAAWLILLNWMSHIIYFGICYSSVIYLKKKSQEV